MAKIKSARHLSQKICITAPGLILLLSLSFSTLAVTAASDEARWLRVNTPTEGEAGNWVLADGSDVQHLTMTPDGTLYACGKGLTYTLYQSTDGGYRWSHLGKVQDNIVDIAIAPDETGTIYYATSSTVYRSTNGGKSFDAMPSDPGGAGSNNVEITAIAVTHLDGNIIAVGTRDTDSSQYGGVYTLDQEQAVPGWEDSSLGNYDVYAVAFSPNFPANRQLVAVVTDETDTYITSQVGEAAWDATIGNARLDKDNSGTPVSVAAGTSAAIAFPDDYDAASGDCRLFVAIATGSDDGDAYEIDAAPAPDNSTATDLNVGLAYGLSNIDLTGLSVNGDATAANLLAGAATSSRTYFSADGGSTWKRSRRAPTGGSRTSTLMAPDFGTSGTAYSATSGDESAFSVTHDSGVTWNQVGLIDSAVSSIVDLAPSPVYHQDNTLFLLTFDSEHSLWRSTNNGATWQRIFTSALTGVDSLDLVELSPRYGNSRQVVYVAGSSNSRSAIWKSTDNGQNFTLRLTADPSTGAAITINTWAVVDDSTLFIGSYDGSKGLVYLTTNGGLSYNTGTIAGSQSFYSLVLSPDYEQDETILIGNSSGWVYQSTDNGASFRSLPTYATSSPLTGAITVAFDPDFSNNHTLYAASATADEGVYRFITGTGTEWESIDSNLPGDATLNQVVVAAEGILYSANSRADGGLERCLEPTYPLGPVFETVTRGLSDNATLFGLWRHGHRLWSVDTATTRLMTFDDSLTSPVISTSPADSAAGIGNFINYTVSNTSIDWEPVSGATGYQWQLDYDTDFSTVPGGFEGSTNTSSARLPTLEPGATYYWRVRVSQPVYSPWSTEQSFTTSLDTESAVLRLESPEAGAAGVPVKPLFQWSAVTGADKYELLLSADIHFTNPSIIKTGTYALPATAWQGNISLDYDTTYYWKVRARNVDTYSAWSAVGAFTTESAPVPPVPTPVLSPTMSLPLPTVPSPISPPPPLILPPAPSPPTTPTQPSTAPGWVIYFTGALLLTILLLFVIILVLILGARHPWAGRYRG